MKAQTADDLYADREQGLPEPRDLRSGQDANNFEAEAGVVCYWFGGQPEGGTSLLLERGMTAAQQPPSRS